MLLLSWIGMCLNSSIFHFRCHLLLVVLVHIQIQIQIQIQKCLLSHKSCTYRKHKEKHSVWTFNQYISSLEAVRNIMLYINITVVQSNNTVLQHIHCIIYHDPWYPSVYACFNYCMTTRIDEAEAYWILNICKIFQSFSFGSNCNSKLQHK